MHSLNDLHRRQLVLQLRIELVILDWLKHPDNMQGSAGQFCQQQVNAID